MGLAIGSILESLIPKTLEFSGWVFDGQPGPPEELDTSSKFCEKRSFIARLA